MPSPLISVAELARRLDDPQAPALVDVRWRLGGPPGHADYVAGHLPGAVYVDLDRELADPPGPRGRHPLPAPERFVAAMRRAGVRRGGSVVAYDAADGGPAARLWWLLRHYGFGEVRVLDGGLAAWTDAGLPLVRGEHRPPSPGDFDGAPGAMPVLDAEGAASLARHGVLLDARAAERYRGEMEPVDPVAGHILGAVSAPAGLLLGGDGRLRSAGELADRFAAVGATASAPVGAYCGSGVTAAAAVLALEVAGVPAALYPGSWSEWVALGRPVETGAAAG